MPQQEVHQCQCPNCLGPEHHPDQEIHRQMNLLLSRLDEQQRRWYAAVESAKLGHGGDRFVSLLTGLHVDTIRRGREELAASLARSPRRPGPTPRRGTSRARKKVPAVIPALLSIVGPQTGGDPMGQTKFVRPSLQALSTELGTLGFSACPTTVARLLRGQALLAPDQRQAVHRAGPPRPGPAVPQHPGVDRHLRRSWACRSSASTARRRN